MAMKRCRMQELPNARSESLSPSSKISRIFVGAGNRAKRGAEGDHVVAEL